MSMSKLEIWKDRISECKASGLPVTEWCKVKGLTKAKYYYWHKIIHEAAMSEEAKPIFAEVLVPIETPVSKGIKLTYKDIDISLSNKADTDLVVHLIHELQKQC
ncbi:MAG: IS66 family insertion sequence element accessory protein TnpA [Cellulosilyticaceae bacterium]